MTDVSSISRIGLTLFLGALIVFVIQLMGFMPSLAFITIVGPITIVIGLIIFALGFLVKKKTE